MSNRKINWKNETTLQLIANEVTKSPGNLTAAFASVAAKLGTSKGMVSFMWYSKGLRETVGTQFTTVSRKANLLNKKNIPETRKDKSKLIYENIVSSSTLDGVRVEMVKRIYAA